MTPSSLHVPRGKFSEERQEVCKGLFCIELGLGGIDKIRKEVSGDFALWHEIFCEEIRAVLGCQITC